MRAPSPGPAEFVLTERPRGAEALGAMFRRLAADLAARDAEVLSLMIYGSLAARDEAFCAMGKAWGEVQWPVTWIEGASCDGRPIAGVQAFALGGRPIERVRLGHQVIGSVFEDGGARHCLLGGLGPTALSLSAPAQAWQAFANLEWELAKAGFELADVVRTWFYNDNIAAWYADFNRARTAHYKGVNWRTGSLPASTGIGARNPAGAALTLAAWAMRPHTGTAPAREIGSPLQCPAPAYGSAFSRAVEIDSGGWRRLLVSGTAAIHPDGRTAWTGNAPRQVQLTMEVVAAILQSRGMDFGDVRRATAYFKHPEDKPHFDAWIDTHELQSMPVVAAHCDICREDLLFEIELDAGAAG